MVRVLLQPKLRNINTVFSLVLSECSIQSHFQHTPCSLMSWCIPDYNNKTNGVSWVEHITAIPTCMRCSLLQKLNKSSSICSYTSSTQIITVMSMYFKAALAYDQSV